MFQILTEFKNHKIVEREQLLNQLDIKYTHYIAQLSQQKALITQNIQNHYDKQINRINDLILTHVHQAIKNMNQSVINKSSSNNINYDNKYMNIGIANPQNQDQQSISQINDSFVNNDITDTVSNDMNQQNVSNRTHSNTDSENRKRARVKSITKKNMNNTTEEIKNNTESKPPKKRKRIQLNLSKPQKNIFESMHCIYCLNSFESYPLLRKHIRKIHTQRPFLCKYCPAGLEDRRAQTAHQARHTVHKPYTCKICTTLFKCNTFFVSQGSLTAHKNKFHRKCKYKKTKSKLDIMCEKCLKKDQQLAIIQCSKCHVGYHSYCNQNGLMIKKKFLDSFINICHKCAAKNANRRSTRLKNKAVTLGSVAQSKLTYETTFFDGPL